MSTGETLRPNNPFDKSLLSRLGNLECNIARSFQKQRLDLHYRLQLCFIHHVDHHASLSSQFRIYLT